MSDKIREALVRLCGAADGVGVRHFDSDTLSDEVEEMQQATEAARAALAEQPEPKPALPEPVAYRYRYHSRGNWHLCDVPSKETPFAEEPLYTADQMRAAIAAERAARLVAEETVRVYDKRIVALGCLAMESVHRDSLPRSCAEMCRAELSILREALTELRDHTLREALERINEWCCYATEEDTSARLLALQQIGQAARAAISAATPQAPAPANEPHPADGLDPDEYE